MITKYLSYVLGALLLGAVLTNCNTDRKLQAERLAHTQTRETYAETARIAEQANRSREATHAQEITAITQKASHDKDRLAADVQRLADSLRNRPDRPASGAVPAGSSTSTGCTGAELYRVDAAFLVREAGRADRIRLQLAECQAAHDSAVKLTNPKD